jgi:glycerol-3-phosphate dehydrogenase
VRREPGSLADGVFDLLIVGGGITGAGVALDAAQRGLKVALVDKGDFASATSSASSKLVHGGLRYLERAQLRLVYEALAERRRLLRNAPHFVWPLRFVLPFYRDARLPRWKGRIGLWLYDLLAGSHNLQRSRDLSALQLCRSFPALRTNGLLGAAAYYDAQMDDARLCLDVVRTADQLGANIANYVEVEHIDLARTGGFAEVALRDRMSGEAISARARQVLNAAGPWVDAVRRLAGTTGAAPELEPTKGAHVIIAGTPFAAGGGSQSRNSAFTLLHPHDGRVFFVLPWMGHTLLGTTDTFCVEPADALRVTIAEEQYLLDGYNHYFQAPLKLGDVRGRFAGLRPLLRSRPSDPSARSREFRIIEDRNGLLSVAGGKWTTYRGMAESITDRIAGRRGCARKCRTAQLCLHSAPATAWSDYAIHESAEIAIEFGYSQALSAHLVNRYGRHARSVATTIRERNGCQPVVAGEPDVVGEWEYQRREEMALTRADHLLRRSRIGMWHEDLLFEG